VSLHSEYEEKLIKLAERRSTHDQTLTAQDDILKKYSGRAVIRALAVLAQEADAQSRDYLNKLVEAGDFNMESIKKYKELRALYHLRTEKHKLLSTHPKTPYK